MAAARESGRAEQRARGAGRLASRGPAPAGAARRSSSVCHSIGPATSVWLPSGRPRISCARAEHASSAARSIAGLRCPSRAASRRGPRWRCCPSRRPAPDSRRARRSSTRSSARPPRARPARSRGPCPRVLWKCAVSSTAPAPSSLWRALEEAPHLHRVRHPGRVAEADLLGAGVAQARSDCQHALGPHLALVGAAERGRDHGLAAQALGAGAGEHALESGERLLDGAVHVVAVVRVRGRQEHVDLVERGARPAGPLAQRERRVEPALVGDQHRHAHLGGDVDRLQHLGRVGELRDHVGAHEAGHLQAAQAGARERVDQLDLGGGRDHLGLVLEAVARTDLADAHLRGQLAHGLTRVTTHTRASLGAAHFRWGAHPRRLGTRGREPCSGSDPILGRRAVEPPGPSRDHRRLGRPRLRPGLAPGAHRRPDSDRLARALARRTRPPSAHERVAPDGTFTGHDNAGCAGAAPVVILSVPFATRPETLAELKDSLAPGQLLIDATVPLAAAVGGQAHAHARRVAGLGRAAGG